MKQKQRCLSELNSCCTADLHHYFLHMYRAGIFFMNWPLKILQEALMSRVMRKPTFCICENKVLKNITRSLNEPRHEKTNILHMRKQSPRSASQ